MISLDEALAIYPTIAPLEAVERSLEDCLGLRTVQRVLAPVDLPLADQSALDGYALNSADTESASTDSPVILEIDGEQAAGPLEATSVRPNTCRRIYTGAWLPDGFDAMVAQERVDASDSQIHLTHPVPQGNNIRQRGEEIRQSALLLPSGELIDPGRLAMLAMAGVGTLAVRPAPRIALMITGTELVPAGQSLQPGQAFDSNGPALRALLKSWGHPLVASANAPDDRHLTTQLLEELTSNADIVVTTGGVSVGAHDHVRAAARACGFAEVFWRVAQKPGKPMLLARRGKQWLMGLPGNPAAVYVCAQLHLASLIRRLGGHPGTPPWQTARLQSTIQPDRQRDCLVRVSHPMGSEHGVQPLPAQASHMLSNLREADGLVRIRAGNAPLEAGTELEFLRFETNFSFQRNS